MKNGYDQFFKAAKSARNETVPKKLNSKTDSKAKAKKNSMSEADIEEHFKQQLKVGRTRPKQKMQIPWVPAVLAGIGFSIAILGVVFTDEAASLLDRFEIQMLSQADAKSEKTPAKTTPTKDLKEEVTASKDEGQKDQAGKGWTEEELSHFNKLNDRKKQLDQRESELSKLEDELHKQKLEIEVRIEKLKILRAEISGVLKERVDADEGKVTRLVDFYSNMKPAQAAEIIGKLNEDLAIQVLGRMKKKSAADILNLIDPKKAKILSEKFAGYQRR